MSNKSKKIVMIRADCINPDSRLEKEATSLGKNGYDVVLLGWDRTLQCPICDKKYYYSISRLRLRSPYGIKILLYLPIWWIRSCMCLCSQHAEFIHAVNFDTLLPSIVAAKINKSKIVYDIFDFYSDLMPLPKGIRKIAKKIDLFLMKYVDKIIIVDDCRYKQINQTNENKNTVVIYNSPPVYKDLLFNNLNGEKPFCIFYGGSICPERDISSMIQIVKERNDLWMVIAGIGDPKYLKEIDVTTTNYDNITYLGTIPYEKVLSYSQDADILFALYDPSIPNNKVASPNKLFEAMMLGKPIIVNEGTAATDKVREENCGLVVPYGDVDALRDAVLKLKNNPLLRKELGENGRRAYETKYSWTIMEKRLLDLYKSLESE